MQENYPSEEEQEEAWRYCCQRVLERPDTDIKRAVKPIALFLLFICGITVFICALLRYFAVVSWLNPVLTVSLVFAALVFTGLLACSKRIIIGLVRLYQRYAPERIRRKCIFKPTCSEYMILAVEKYGVIKGLYKGIFRLFVRCKGFYYSIDYP
jgi:putative component of membrane protein insertase Oxa1/YidC/SpoIIIJ protein YidD